MQLFTATEWTPTSSFMFAVDVSWERASLIYSQQEQGEMPSAAINELPHGTRRVIQLREVRADISMCRNNGKEKPMTIVILAFLVGAASSAIFFATYRDCASSRFSADSYGTRPAKVLKERATEIETNPLQGEQKS
jgi:hypothetical protein